MAVGMKDGLLEAPFQNGASFPSNVFPLLAESGGPIGKPPYRLLLVLLLVGLLCRTVAALWWGDLLWADSIFYLRIAEALEKGDFTTAFDELGLNFYPVIFMKLRQIGGLLGLDWTMVGKWWSVALASLAILPLYGWVRRIWDDRVAFWTGLFYAIHPQLVGHSPLIIRDPTYWFLFNTAVYLTWRAVTENRLLLFILSGSAIGLAAYTRLEGWLLVVLVLGWAFYRAVYVREGRWRLTLGVILSIAVIPTAVVGVNLTWLKDHPRWEWGRVPMIQRIWKWTVRPFQNFFPSEARHLQVPLHGSTFQAVLSEGEQIEASLWPSSRGRRGGVDQRAPSSSMVQFVLAESKTPSSDSRKGPFLESHQKMGLSESKGAAEGLKHAVLVRSEKVDVSPGRQKMVSEWTQGRRTALRLLKAFTYPYALLIGIGLLRGWRLLLRGDQMVFSVHNVLLFLAIWAYQSTSSGIDLRYFFPMLMIALPYGVLGFETIVDGLTRLGRRKGRDSTGNLPQTRIVGTCITLLGIVLLGLPDLQPSALRLMQQQTALGQWIFEQMGAGAQIMCPESAANLLSYHAKGAISIWLATFPTEKNAARELFAAQQPDVVALWEDPGYPNQNWKIVVAELCEEFGYALVPSKELPEPARNVQVWIRASEKSP